MKKKSGNLDKSAKDDPTFDLYRAAARYVESMGGFVTVIGGIGVMRLPGEPKLNFSLVIRCIGTQPKPNAAEAQNA